MTETAPLPTPPQRRRIRWRYVVIAAVCAIAIAWMVVLLQRNVVFFKPVSEAVQDQASDGTRTMRIGGGVVPASIVRRTDGVDFDLTEGNVTVRIHHVGSEPPLFKDCAPVVAEGKWSAASSSTFDSTRILIKHGNDYRPPESATVKCPEDPFKQ